MKKTLFFSTLFICLFYNTFAQNDLTVSSLVGVPVDSILQQHLAGEGVLMSGHPDPYDAFGLASGKFNNQTTVSYPQIGTFNRNEFTNFPFETGLVMTTGHVSVAAGPNNSGGASQPVSPYYIETALQPMASFSINGSASLEFDFVASADMFAFNYIFGSEEYCEYVNSSFNDVLAFFLTGLDPVTFTTTTKNVAIVPGSITASNPNGTPVSINNVNSGNPCGTGGVNSTFYIDNPTGAGVQYDGYTTALAAAATILACQKYHMKMAIGNVGDNGYDSGIFLEKSNFYSPRVQTEQVWETDDGGDTLQLDRELDLLFKLPRPALTGHTDIIINPSGDAILGVDYSLVLPDGPEITYANNSFSFQPGDTLQQIHVKILPTAQFDPDMPVKTVVLDVITQGCSGTQYWDGFPPYHDTITLHLRMSGTGIEEISKEEMRLYPNPAKNYLQVDFGTQATDIQVLELVNSNGQVVRRVNVSETSVRLDTSDLPAGMYFVRAVTENGKVSLPFVKQ